MKKDLPVPHEGEKVSVIKKATAQCLNCCCGYYYYYYYYYYYLNQQKLTFPFLESVV